MLLVYTLMHNTEPQYRNLPIISAPEHKPLSDQEIEGLDRRFQQRSKESAVSQTDDPGLKEKHDFISVAQFNTEPLKRIAMEGKSA